MIDNLRNRPAPRILVVGDIMIDQTLSGTCDRISPEAPIPVVDVVREQGRLGGAGNVANNLLSLGADVVIGTVIGDDAVGRQIEHLVQDRGLSIAGLVRDPSRQSTRKKRVMVNHQLVVRLDYESRSPLTEAIESRLIDAITQQRGRFDALLLSDYNKGVLTPVVTQAVIAWASKKAIPVLVDPKGTDPAKYRGASILTPNRTETIQLTGRTSLQSDDDLLRAGRALRKVTDGAVIVVTLSEQGMAVVEDRLFRIPAEAKEVFDVTGAGDTVLATLGYGVACGLPTVEAAGLANRAAAVVVGKIGTAAATWEQIDGLPRQVEPQSGGTVCSVEAIQEVARRLRREGRRIVFTNGCFDLLHRGHVEYLQASRACGDCLIVGINSDASVRKVKGPKRPVVGQEDRAHILAALSGVDYVVIFDEETPVELLRHIRPDVLTKGADYQTNEVVGRELANEVRLISFVQGRSTSRTIDRIHHAA